MILFYFKLRKKTQKDIDDFWRTSCLRSRIKQFIIKIFRSMEKKVLDVHHVGNTMGSCYHTKKKDKLEVYLPIVKRHAVGLYGDGRYKKRKKQKKQTVTENLMIKTVAKTISHEYLHAVFKTIGYNFTEKQEEEMCYALGCSDKPSDTYKVI